VASEKRSVESTMELVDLVRQGDHEALDRLVARHIGPLRRWVSGRLPRARRDLADTDDLVQDVLLRTLRTIGDFEVRGPGALHAYLRQALTNRVRDELRRHGRAPVRVDLELTELVADDSPLERTMGREAVDRYRAALERLHPDEREAVVARLEMDRSYAEIADILGKPTADAARKATARALVRLAGAMRP
jgi:RNA polymerase sigma-70 factor, ECF subfamily